MNTPNNTNTVPHNGRRRRKGRYGFIAASPAEFVIHRRFGRTLHLGRGISFVSLPFIDRCYFIPCTAQSISFSADQITAENQGVEVSGFAIWKVNDSEKAAATFDFEDGETALVVIAEGIRNVVESAIRHQVANMTIEDVLRKRGSIILQLKSELAYIAGQWGVEIETVEIKGVRVLSSQLFAQMQAQFRDTMRLASETSALETEEKLETIRFAQKEAMALKEEEFERRELERATEAARMKVDAEAKLDLFRLEQQRGKVAVETQLHEATAALEISRAETDAALASLTDDIHRKQVATANTEDTLLAIVKQLPATVGALKINELNVGDDSLRALANHIHRAWARLGTSIESGHQP